jgi:hypothetical protein
MIVVVCRRALPPEWSALQVLLGPDLGCLG